MDLELNLEKQNQYYRFYCPCCGIERRIRMHPNPNRPINFLRVGIATLVVTLAFYPWMDVKGLVSAVPLWIVFETVYRLKVRSLLACLECGFDPYLFKDDISRAKAAIEAHWRERFQAKGIPYPEKPTKPEPRIPLEPRDDLPPLSPPW